MFASAYVEAILLGILQGITEFLPVSSSGHLVIASEIIQEITGKEYDSKQNLEMNVALHLGTLVSILWVYRREILIMIQDRRMILMVGLATFPLVFIALTPLKDIAEQFYGNPAVVGFSLLVTALLLLIGQVYERGSTDIEKISTKQALTVGLMQSLAIIPGISRSGSTISTGLVSGMKREVAATFSFLIAIPAISGAAILELKNILSEQGSHNPVPVLFAGGIVACIVGILSLKMLIKMVNQKKLHWFSWYCFVLGLSVLAWQFCF